MSAVAQPPVAGRRGRSSKPGIYAGRYLTQKAKERQRDAATESARRRAAFHGNRDAAYRRALGLADGEPLPTAIGQTQHSHANTSAPITAKRVAA